MNWRYAILVAVLATFRMGGLGGAEIPPPGVPLDSHPVQALVGGRVVVKPGAEPVEATIVIRDERIIEVGKDVQPPPDAQVTDLKGATIYAGFIDACVSLSGTNGPAETSETEPPRFAASDYAFLGAGGGGGDSAQPGAAGHALASVTPEYRVARAKLPDAKAMEALRELGFTAAHMVPSKGILRGSTAVVALGGRRANESILREDPFQYVCFEPPRGGDGQFPGSLMGVIATVRQVLMDARQYQLDQADYRQHPKDRRRPPSNPALAALDDVLQKRQTVLFEPGSALMVDRAARVAREAGVQFAILASGQEWRRPELAVDTKADFIVPVNFPQAPKLPNEDDWSQVSLDALRAWDWAPENPALLRRKGLNIALTTYGLSSKKDFRERLRAATDRGLSESDALAALTTTPARMLGLADRLGTVEAGKLAYLTVIDGTNYFRPKTRVREVWIDGRRYPAPPELPKSGSDDASKKAADEAKASGKDKAASAERNDDKDKDKDKEKAPQARVARAPSEDRGPAATPRSVLIQDATIWTSSPAGRIAHGDLVVVDGKIRAISQHQAVRSDAGAGVVVIDGRGLHVTPGIVDAHSHSMILGGVNEATLPSTAMVRIGDVVNSETSAIFQQLGGGVTVVNLLHGSANPIGGQSCVIKLRDGAAPEELKLAGAPEGIKFALGENVKQSNWGEKNTTRFPQTRMGVRTFFHNRFTAAREYQKAWQNFREKGGLEPRRDLELEAITEILEHKRWIHCHSYRQDEILAFMRVMEEFQVQIGTLQHILEGYKVADEIAKHGAGASCFADWWAYKFEVYDAIPYAGSLMRERGVLVSFNSDSGDLARHLNFEAAKAVKYGGTSEEEALKFVTINPARQLRIDSMVGSLEAGKDADFAIWSGSPLDSRSVCLQTWVDGKQYFTREVSDRRAGALAEERKALLAKIRKPASKGKGDDGKDGGESGGDGGGGDDGSFFRSCLEHEYDGRERHCMDGVAE